MRKIAELTMLLRGQVELPADLNLVTEEFQEGWSFVQSGDTHWLDKEVRARGWHFMWIGEGSRRRGIGQTPQKAIAGALKRALRCVSARFNAAEVECIEVKKYLWFVLARVKAYPYQIQQGSVLSSFDRTVPLSIALPAKAVVTPGNQVAPAIR